MSESNRLEPGLEAQGRGLWINVIKTQKCCCMETEEGAFKRSVQKLTFLLISTSNTLFFQGMDVNIFKEAFESPKVDFILSHAIYCRDVLKLKKGQRAVISNGRVSSISRCVK